METQKLFRDKTGRVKPWLNAIEGANYQESPLDFLILLARYKFAARLLDPNDTTLDAGCGHGIGSVMLSRFAGSVTALDIDQELIKYCRNTYGQVPKLKFEVGDMKDLSTLNQRFDAIVCMDTIEHFTEEDGPVVLQGLVNGLKDRGMLIIGTPNIRSSEFASQRRKLSHLFEYDYATFKRLLSRFFPRTMIFSMTDETVSTGFGQLAWYFMGVCIK